MRRRLLSATAGVALAAALILPMNVAIALPQGGMPRARAEAGERHPEIRAAIRHLEQAKAALEKAKHDYQGHRASALEHTNQALEECHKALEADKK